MAKRSLQQIQESLVEQFYKYRRRGDDLGPEMGGGSFGLGGVTRSPSQFGRSAGKTTPKEPVQTPPPAPPSPPPASKPRVQVKPGETQDQAMLRTQREKIAKDRNDQSGAKVWRPGESKPKVWRTPDGKSSSQPPGRGGSGRPPGSKPPGKEPPMSGDKSSRREIPDPLTAKEKRSAAYKSGGIHAAAALAAMMALKKDKDAEPPGGSEPGADSSGVTWVNTADFVPKDDTNKEIVNDPKSSAAVIQDPATSTEQPIPEPEIRLEPVKPPRKPDVAQPDKQPAEPEKPAPKKEKKVPVPEPVPAPSPVPSTKTVPADGGSRGETDTPSTRPKNAPGVTPGGTGDKPSADGTGNQSGTTQGPDSGPGTGKEFKPERSGERLMRDIWEQTSTQLKLLEKYKNFLGHNNHTINEEKLTPRQAIEQYLGKTMTNSEYSAFLRTVGAESGREPLERAHIASVILNRAKAARGDIIGVLNTPAQFQAITGPSGNQGTAFKPYYSTATKIIPGIDQEIANTLSMVRPGLTHFSAASPAAYRDVGGMKKYREVMKMYSKDPNRERVFASVFGNLGPVPYNPNANLMVQKERKQGDRLRDQFANLVEPSKPGQAALPTAPKDSGKKETDKPGYYTVGDSHGQGIAVYGKGKDGPSWINKSKVGASVVDKDQFKTHMANIESIPAGSVVTISGGANDIGRPNHQAIVDNLNKLIAASKAKGHQVVYVLPTESPDPAKQAQREQLRQTLLKGVQGANIVDLGMASKTDKQQVHLDPKGYKTIAKNISDMFIPSATAAERPAPVQQAVHPIGTQVQPDWSKYKFGDLGTVEKIGPNEWRTTKGNQIIRNAPELDVLPAVPKPESFTDKLKRVAPPFLGGKGELVSQVFGDKKKSTVQPPAEKSVAPLPQNKQPDKDTQSAKDSGPDWIDKLYSTNKAREVQARWAADAAKANEPEAEPAKPKTVQSASGIISYPEKPAEKSVEKAVSATPLQGPDKGSETKDKQKSVELQRDQVGLLKAKRELSDFEQAFAAARAKGDKEFTWQDKQGKPYQVAVKLKGKKPAASADVFSKSVPASQSLDQGEEVIDVPKATSTSATDRFKAPESEPKEPISSEIQQALKDFEKEKENQHVANMDLKESINTESNADLHDILRLAGRIK